MSKKYSFSPEKKESNSTIFIIIGILLILIVVGVGALIFVLMNWVDGPTPPIIQDNITNLTNITNVTETCNDQCVLSLALNNNNHNLCSQINDSSVSQTCYLQFANSSLSPCLKLTDETNLVLCVEFHALEQNDIGICNNLNASASISCKEKIDPCASKIGSEYSFCMAKSKDDYQQCNLDEICLLEYAKLKGNTDACIIIPDTVKEAACKSIVQNQDFCYLMTQTSQKDLCYQKYAMDKGDSLICTQISTDSIYSLECLSFFAVKESKLYLCDSLSLNNRWSCYTNYSFGSNDLTGCNNIDKLASTARFKCFFEFAKMHGNPSACDPIGDSAQITSCYVGSILSNPLLDYTTCNAVANTDWKNKCFFESAKLKDDPTLCDLIETENERKNCRENLD